MKSELLRTALADIANKPGFIGSALVSVEDGMVWQAVGSLGEMESIASAASNYWRLNARTRSSFTELGALQIAILVHVRGYLTFCECGEGMLLVVVSDRSDPNFLSKLTSAHANLNQLIQRI